MTNKENISDSAHAILSILKVLGPINRHVSGEVPIEDRAFLEIANRNVAGGLESAIKQLALNILELSEA